MRWTCLIVGWLFFVGLCPLSNGQEVFRFPEGRQGNGELKYHQGIPVLTVHGSPTEMGAAVGTLAVKPGLRVLDYPRELLGLYSAGFLWSSAVRQGKDMVPQFPDDHRKELEAMAETSGAAWEKLVAGNTLFDIKKLFLCSGSLVTADRSATGGPLLGRNLDYPSLGYIHEYSLVTVYRPKGKHAFAAIGFPGLVGTLSGMNDAGLAVGVLEVFGARAGEGRFDAKGIPYGLCFRTLLEECTTIEEAKTRLEKMQRTTMLNLVIADRTSIGVFEITPRSVVFRKPARGTLACTNHFCTELKPERPADMARSFDRFETLATALSARQKLTVADLHQQLDAVHLGEFTLQTMVFEPASLKLHLAIGTAPASGHKLRTVDLAPFFGKTR